MLYSRTYLSDTSLDHVLVWQLQPDWGDQTQPAEPTAMIGKRQPTTCVTLRWSAAILQDYILSRASNLLWLAWPNFGLKGTFFPLWVLLTTHWRKKKIMFLKGFLLFPFLRTFREFNNCWPLANTQTKVFFELRLHLDPSCQIFQAVYL